LSQSASIFKERRPAQNALILGIHFINFSLIYRLLAAFYRLLTAIYQL
jgi:hypothetical protein